MSHACEAELHSQLCGSPLPVTHGELHMAAAAGTSHKEAALWVKGRMMVELSRAHGDGKRLSGRRCMFAMMWHSSEEIRRR